MFDQLTGKLGTIFNRLNGRGVLTEDDVNAALREVRIALLEADVALPVAKDFIEKVRTQAVGVEVLKSIKPGQQVVKIVNDVLVETLSGTDGQSNALNINTAPPAVILMVGLQGSGKTTSTAKLGLHLKNKLNKKALMASLDTQRPAAQEQLEVLGRQISVATLPIVKGETPLQITQRAMNEARLQGFDVLLLDTAGRLSIDDALMDEVAAVKKLSNPIETLLVADAMTGQDAVNTAKNFNDRVGVTGSILTRVDGDARGGAALSMRAVTGQPIKFVGLGEKTDALDVFNAERMAGRILGMGDIVALVEKAAETIDQAEAEKMAQRMMSGQFDLNDLANQMDQMKKMGGITKMLGFLPGLGNLGQLASMAQKNVSDKDVLRQRAIISSMTKKERSQPDIIKASRKIRIAKGAGVDVHDVNKLLKQFQQMADMMKRLPKMSKMGAFKNLLGSGGIPKDLEGLAGNMPANIPGGMDLASMMQQRVPGKSKAKKWRK